MDINDGCSNEFEGDYDTIFETVLVFYTTSQNIMVESYTTPQNGLMWGSFCFFFDKSYMVKIVLTYKHIFRPSLI